MRRSSPDDAEDRKMLDDFGVGSCTTAGPAEGAAALEQVESTMTIDRGILDCVPSRSLKEEEASDSETVSEIVRRGWSPENRTGTALREACFVGNESEASRLLELASDIDHRSASGVTALMAAVAGGLLPPSRGVLSLPICTAWRF